MSERSFTKRDMKLGKRRCEKATGGPWKRRRVEGCKDIGPHRKGYQRGIDAIVYTTGIEEAEDRANADFIVHARTYYPLALASLKEAWAILDELVSLPLDNEGLDGVNAKAMNLLGRVGFYMAEDRCD